VAAKFASYTDDVGVMLDGTAQYKMFTLDGGGGTSVFGQGKPYFWGTRAIRPNDPLPGLFKWTKETYPEAKNVGVKLLVGLARRLRHADSQLLDAVPT
jgi:hypothetical protein